MQAAAEMCDWHGCRMSAMELSHRGAEFGRIIERARNDLRDLLEIPESHRILFMQGGATAMNADHSSESRQSSRLKCHYGFRAHRDMVRKIAE